MPYRQVCPTREQTQPTTPIPAKGKARIERESANSLNPFSFRANAERKTKEENMRRTKSQSLSFRANAEPRGGFITDAPHTRRSRYPSGPAQLGGHQTFKRGSSRSLHASSVYALHGGSQPPFHIQTHPAQFLWRATAFSIRSCGIVSKNDLTRMPDAPGDGQSGRRPLASLSGVSSLNQTTQTCRRSGSASAFSRNYVAGAPSSPCFREIEFLCIFEMQWPQCQRPQ